MDFVQSTFVSFRWSRIDTMYWCHLWTNGRRQHSLVSSFVICYYPFLCLSKKICAWSPARSFFPFLQTKPPIYIALPSALLWLTVQSTAQAQTHKFCHQSRNQSVAKTDPVGFFLSPLFWLCKKCFKSKAGRGKKTEFIRQKRSTFVRF